MEKMITIDLLESEHFFEAYNRKKVSRELINYLVAECYNLDKNDCIKIIINDAMGEDINCIELIKEGLKREYFIYYRRHKSICLKQLIYLVLGVIVLFVSTLLDGDIFREIVLILGWVLIWTMFELEIFSDVDSKKKRKILKRLLNSHFIENNL